MPGEYTFQRSLDGGKTWTTQSTTLTTTGQVSQIGWSDSTFLLGMQLDAQLQGSSAVIAFPKGQPSVHLDVNGKLNGKAIKHLRLLTGHNKKIVAWGDDGSAAQNVTGLATTDLGKSWASQPNSTPGGKLGPTASSDDGNALVATSADNQQIAVSTDGGANWTAQPSFAGAQERQRRRLCDGQEQEGRRRARQRNLCGQERQVDEHHEQVSRQPLG